MKKIGFRNFRRFVDFDPLDMGNLTLLSGGNNSGKSTIVKAAMLAMNFLKTPRVNGATDKPCGVCIVVANPKQLLNGT